MQKLFLAALVSACAFLASPLPAVHWTQIQGSYLCRPEGGQEIPHLYDWQRARASLVFPPIPAGHGRPGADHPCHLLPEPVRESLARLGAVLPERGGLRCTCHLSIACTVHQPCREASFAASERLWYRNDVPIGESAVLFIPLSRGRVNFAMPADFSTTGARVAALPNGFREAGVSLRPAGRAGLVFHPHRRRR